MDASLSICIPTFERPQYLKWTLQKLMAWFPGSQICVSDNHSPITDDFRPGEWPIKYLRQKENIGPFPNFHFALSMASHKYALYCADDDYVLPEGVRIGIEYLEEHPEVAAYCAPCEIWDEVEHKLYWNAWEIPEAITLGRGVDLFNLIISRHIWPEHLIYRLPLPIKARTRAYWAFTDLADILDHGLIHFSRVPYYRNLLTHPVGERIQLGNVQCLTEFDSYRAGLEVLACRLFWSELPYRARHQIHDMIASFICARMDVASRLYARQGHEVDAQMLRQRIAIADPRQDAA
jgi:glycosyltransferase involved in cell wall biosynthesis